MICILHGYLLEGSGSNLWTRAVVLAMCRLGKVVHLVCQEPHPENYDFISEAYLYHESKAELLFKRPPAYAGYCVFHKPQLGDTLPVYVWDRYEEFSRVTPMVELPDHVIEDYLNRNVQAVLRIVKKYDIQALHANHAVLMSVVARRVKKNTGIPFAIMPHGSAIEYAVKKDQRFFTMAGDALEEAGQIFVIGPELRQRMKTVFGEIKGLNGKMTGLNLGVDTALFKLTSRSERSAAILRLVDSLKKIPRGKNEAKERKFFSRLSGNMTLQALKLAIESFGKYDGKAPDESLEKKLATVNWESDANLLFVGRLISNKGLPALIAALPLVATASPKTLRLFVVGHGPLREPMEALLWAFEHNERDFAISIADNGRFLEDGKQGPFSALRLFFDHLKKRGLLNDYFEKAALHVRRNRVIFTGYLTHERLRFLFSCCDVAVFPSIVAEAGPLVFLEAMASGCFPIGAYFAGMAASIDFAARHIPKQDVQWMKLCPDESDIAADIANKVPKALNISGKHRQTLRKMAVENYDWQSVAARLDLYLKQL